MLFRILLCLLVVGTHTHCVLAHGAELVRAAENRADSPIGDEHPCENESSCICKGATLGDSLTVAPPHNHFVWLCSHDDARATIAILVEPEPVRVPDAAPPPDTAAARALLQLYQL